ncbi:MAG: hypothetical protein P8163_16345 [Candidatus Thiodiazotropha sp.]
MSYNSTLITAPLSSFIASSKPISILSERLPSGKFATNVLVLRASMLAYKILCYIGQNGLLGPGFPKRNKAKRRRIKTVMQELMYVAARMIRTARTIKLSFRCGCRSLVAFTGVYRKLAYE